MLMSEVLQTSYKRDYSRLDNTTRHWYVMLSRSPKLLDFQLRRENAGRQLSMTTPLLEYFIPFCFLSRVSDDVNGNSPKDIADTNNLREDLHDFVFIHTTARDVARLLDSEWNRSMRHHLHHYRDFEHNEVILGDDEMQKLIKVFGEKRIRFTIGLPMDDIGPDVVVKIKEHGSFAGQEARVIKVKHTAEGISLMLGIPMFNKTKELRLTDIKLSDILPPHAPDDLIGNVFIQNTEQALLDILAHRVHHNESEDILRQDAVMLNHLFLYSYVQISDKEEASRFLALMLICAHLRYDEASVRVLSRKVEALLVPEHSLPPHVQAYLNFALFIATRSVPYRTAGKQCVLSHPNEATPSLFRLMSLIRQLRGKRR